MRVIELFAGVGGFRIGLERASIAGAGYQIIWSNQWEPGTNVQYASDIYTYRFGSKGHSNADIASVEVAAIPDHDLLVGGFPCQDYSVAKTLNQASGIVGKKGVLWWEIHRILRDKGIARPRYLMLENVDRLLKSPAKQRGRDFAVMLSSLNDLGYAVEWRVVNAADYGFPQRRRRVFLLGYHRDSSIFGDLTQSELLESMLTEGVIAKAFPVDRSIADNKATASIDIDGDIVKISDLFNVINDEAPFENSGVAVGGRVYTKKVFPAHDGLKTMLGDILIDEREVPEQFFVSPEDIDQWKYLKGAKKAPRKSTSGHVYNYSEGPMAFPDPADRPSRTIVTGEGGSTPSRFKHVVKTESGRLRRLTPIELERLNMFPDGHTALTEKGLVPDARRAFMMGNALVIGVVERLGVELLRRDRASSIDSDASKALVR